MPVTWVLDPPVFIPLPGVPLPPEGTILSELEVPDSYVVPEATLVVPARRKEMVTLPLMGGI